MWVRLERGSFERAAVRVHGREVRLYDERNQRGLCLAKKADHDDPARARREADEIVARRIQRGWNVVDRIESPWVDWLLELELSGSRVASMAADVGLSVEHAFKLLAPSRELEPVTVHSDYRDLVRAVAFVRHHFRFWRENLRLQISFELHAARDHVTWAERQWVPDVLLQRGALGPDGGVEVVDVDHGDVTRWASAHAFREGFVSHVRARADAAIQSLF
jgi:hypothetical protein